jgi:hypothetical protein
VSRWPNLQLADWSTVSETTPGGLAGGGPHLRAAGARAFADLMFTALDRFVGQVPVVMAFGRTKPRVSASSAASTPPRMMASARGGADVWFATAEGLVRPRRGTRSYGSLTASSHAPVVGMSATPSGKGYWLVASDGGVFTFGDAHFYGSSGSSWLLAPIVGMSATPTGHGYWLVAANGGVFPFGDARFRGSAYGLRLRAPIVGMSATASGHGYWLVASDGGVFTFGDARFCGSAGALRLHEPIVGMGATKSGKGYWLVASDGGVFAFGDARFYGSGVGLHAATGTEFFGVARDAHGYLLGGFMTKR